MHSLNRSPLSHLLNSYSDFKETDEIARESYETSWLDLQIETRPEFRMTLVEKDVVRMESYESKQVVCFTVRRLPNQTMQMGRERQPLKQYALPYKSILPIPVFKPRDISHSGGNREPSPSLSRNKHRMNFDLEISSTILKPKDFRASSLISPPRDTLHLQFREGQAAKTIS